MPVQSGKDSKGKYYKYGDSGAKYYYTSGDSKSRMRAKRKAARQGRAIKANQ